MTPLRILLVATLLLGCRAHEPAMVPDERQGALGAGGRLDGERPVLLILMDDLNLDTFDRALAGQVHQ